MAEEIIEKNAPFEAAETKAEETLEIKSEETLGKKKAVTYNKREKKLYFGKFGIKRNFLIIIAAVILLIIAGNIFSAVHNSQKSGKTEDVIVQVERRSIENTVTASSTVQAKDSYDVTAMVTGEIMSDTFSEGDIVAKDDILYQIDATTAQNSVDSAKNSLVKSQQAYNDAVYNNRKGNSALLTASDAVLKAESDYADAVKAKANNSKTNDYSIQSALNSVEKSRISYNSAMKSLEDLTIKSTCTGTVSQVYVKKGDNVSNGTKIADVYNDKYMKINIPFNTNDAANIYNGQAAEVTVVGTGNKLYGTVSAVSSASVATDAHSIVRYVTIEVTNPGALTTKDKATATVNGISCSGSAQFEYIDTDTITAKTSGKVSEVDIDENDKVSNGEAIVFLTSDTIEDTLANAELVLDDANINLEKAVLASDDYSQDTKVKNAKLALDEAKAAYNKSIYSGDASVTTAALDLDNARLSLEKAEKVLEDYTIKAPIAGTVVTKNKKAGDKLESGSNSSTTGSNAMAVIYDLSSLKIELNIDETEIAGVKVDQEAQITADAVEGEFTGVVTKVGVDGTSSNGVTTYPVTVEIADYGNLLPGMNVDVSIVVERAENVLSVPVTAVNRGDVVYMKGEKTDEKDRAPEGYKSVKVQTGINDSNYIEIKSGIQEGDEIKDASVASGVEASGDATQQNPQQGMGMGGAPGGMGGPPQGGYSSGGMGGGQSGGNRGGQGGAPGGR